MSQWVSANAVFDISVSSKDTFNVCNIHKIFDIVGLICMSKLDSFIILDNDHLDTHLLYFTVRLL